MWICMINEQHRRFYAINNFNVFTRILFVHWTWSIKIEISAIRYGVVIAVDAIIGDVELLAYSFD